MENQEIWKQFAKEFLKSMCPWNSEFQIIATLHIDEDYVNTCHIFKELIRSILNMSKAKRNNPGCLVTFPMLVWHFYQNMKKHLNEFERELPSCLVRESALSRVRVRYSSLSTSISHFTIVLIGR